MDSNINGGKIEPIYLFRRDVSARTAGAVTPSKGGYAIADTTTTAKVGDVYKAETATTSLMVAKQYRVIEASTNSFTIASKDLPTSGDTFFILGPITQRLDATGAILATLDTSLLATEATLDLVKDSLLALEDVDYATETTLALLKADAAAILAKIIAAPSTEAKQDAANASLVSILAKIIAAPATEAKQDAGNASLVSILAKIIAAPATEAKQDTIDTSINTLLKPASTLAAVTTVSTVSAVTAITNALPAGNNNIGDVDIASMPAISAGTNIIGYEIPAPSAASTNALLSVASTALAASQVIKGSAGRLYLLVVTNTKTSSQYIQLHNTTSLPADTAVPIHSILVPPQSSMSLDMGVFGRYFPTGITACNSSTAATKTVGSSDCWFNAEYL